MSAISSGLACRSTASCGPAGSATVTGRCGGTGVGIRLGGGVRGASGSCPDWASNTAWQRPHSTRKARCTGPASPSWTEKTAWQRAQRISTSGLLLVQPERGVQRAHRQLGVLLVDQAAHLDLAGGDDPDVHAFVGQHLEHLGRDAGVVAHADADDRDLGDVVLDLDLAGADLPRERLGLLLAAL